MTTPSADPGAESFLQVTQVRSSISTKPKHRATLRALGLRGVGRARVVPDRPEVRGMLARVTHLVTVEPASSEEADAQRDRQRAARQARRVSQGHEPRRRPARPHHRHDEETS